MGFLEREEPMRASKRLKFANRKRVRGLTLKIKMRIKHYTNEVQVWRKLNLKSL